MVVSLEAILLTASVLMSQNHLPLMADRRAHLNLPVNLLAERELTAPRNTSTIAAWFRE